MSLWRIVAILATGVAATVVLRVQRGLPWSLAGISGLAVTVLSFLALNSLDRLRRIWRDPRG
jgi:hypothetical protein